MNIYTSYFYQIRFFKPWMIPMSTAMYDPKWYHNKQGPNYVYFDKNRVLNGIRLLSFVPGHDCEDLCRGPEGCGSEPDSCEFLKRYRKQLDRIDFDAFIEWAERYCKVYKKTFKLDHEPDIILIFHETPDNPCSERVVMHQWFNDNNYPIREWSK